MIEIEYRVDPAKARLFYAVMQHVQLAVSGTALMGGRSRGTSPILNYGRNAIIAQRGTTICGSEAGRRHRSARCTCAPTNSISVRNPSGFAACLNALLDLCAGKRTHPIDQPATWRRLRARGAAPDQDRPCVLRARQMADRNCRPLPKILCAVDALALALKGGGLCRGQGDHTTSSSSRILGGSVNDLKTTFRDVSAIVRVEAHQG